MSMIMIKCPNTGEPVPTGIGAPFEVFKTMQMDDNVLGNCPSCGASHVWQSSDAFPDS
jgi:endogenous inhibitor of DNA gyrase (YacG/DUF329 family)